MKALRRVIGGLPALALTGVLVVACGERQDGESARAGVRHSVGTAVAAGAAPPASTPTASPAPTPTPLDPAAEVRLMVTAIWATNPPPTPRMTDPDLSQGSPPLGVPAIRPSKPSTGPDDPVFTEQDAREFVERNGVRGLRIRATGPFVVERVEFVPGVTAGSPAYALLCLVTVRGDFQLLGGPAPPPGATPGPPIKFDRVVQTFDAHTGNLLGSDAFPAATPTR